MKYRSYISGIAIIALTTNAAAQSRQMQPDALKVLACSSEAKRETGTQFSAQLKGGEVTVANNSELCRIDEAGTVHSYAPRSQACAVATRISACLNR